MFLQYELWKDCSFGCKYCFNQNIKTKKNKTSALSYAINSLHDRCITHGSTIGFMGGEFFDGQLRDPEVYMKFYKLIGYAIFSLGSTGRLCITTALMSDDLSDWKEFCNFIHSYNYDKNVLVCTSYDSEYRFNKRTLSNWENAMEYTHKYFPDMKIHVEMILTQYLVDSIMQYPDCIQEFEKRWDCRVDFNIPYLPFLCEFVGEDKEKFNERLPGFLPKRKDFLNMIQKYGHKLDLAAISDHRFHSSELHYSLNEKDWIILPQRDKMETTCTNLRPCANCCGYADSDIKMQSDIKMFMKSFI